MPHWINILVKLIDEAIDDGAFCDAAGEAVSEFVSDEEFCELLTAGFSFDEFC